MVRERLSSGGVLGGIGVGLIVVAAIMAPGCSGAPDQSGSPVGTATDELGGSQLGAGARICENVVRGIDNRIQELEAICGGGQQDAGAPPPDDAGDAGQPDKGDSGTKGPPKPDAAPATAATTDPSSDPGGWGSWSGFPGFGSFFHDQHGRECHNANHDNDDQHTKLCHHELVDLEILRDNLLQRCRADGNQLHPGVN